MPMRRARVFRTGHGLRFCVAIAALAVFVWGTIAPAGSSRAEDLPYSTGLLWKVTKYGRHPAHVFGTMHVSDERVRDIPAPVGKALGAADSLFLEIIVQPEDEPRLRRLMTYTDGRTLKQVLGEDLFGRVARAVAYAGVSGEEILPFKPWYVTGLVTVHPDEAMRQSGGRVVLDAALANRARQLGHRIRGLEGFDEHFALFDAMSESDQIQMLRLALKSRRRVRQFYEHMVRLYLNRDLAGIMNVWSQFQAGLEPGLRNAFEEKLLNARNEIMVRRMAPRFAEGRAFVAVGAAHLPGERGVLNLLARRGYAVARVY